MPSTEYDFLIVGQGLAGSILAFALIRRGQKVMVIDKLHQGSSSRVAAGLINPITGHRLNITEQFKQYNAISKRLYRELEDTLDTSLYHSIRQVRRINNAGQAEYFSKRKQESDYRDLLNETHAVEFSKAEYGCAEIHQTSVVDTKRLLESTREWLKSKTAYTAFDFDYAKLEVLPSGVVYDSYHAKKIIFCEGYQAIYNPWLKSLPFKLAKGEILTVRADTAPESMLSWGNWLVPSHEKSQLCKLGSNFAWNDLELDSCTEIKEKLLTSMHENTTVHGTVELHEVGIRPTTALSNLHNAYCFNGLGSKGCLIAPFYTELLSEHLLNGADLPEEVTKWL